MRRGGVGWYPRSGFFHIDSGPLRNWTLDGGGLDHLLLDFQRLVSGGHLAIAPHGKLLVGRAHQPLKRTAAARAAPRPRQGRVRRARH